MFNSSSQASQDQFVYQVLLRNNPTYKGFFLDIGSNHPININNTYNLETHHGWSGLLFDYSDMYAATTKEIRKNPFLQADVTSINWSELIEKYNIPSVIDYVSFDVDDASLKALNIFPFDKLKIKVITMEHDFYCRGESVRDEMRRILTSHGYQIICKDVKNIGNEYEDWWYHPDFVNYDDIKYLESEKIEWSDIQKKYI